MILIKEKYYKYENNFTVSRTVNWHFYILCKNFLPMIIAIIIKFQFNFTLIIIKLK